MYKSLCRLLPLALLAATPGCDDKKADDKKADDKKADDKKADDKKADDKKADEVTPEVAEASTVLDCTGSYNVVGAVANAVLSESIDGVVFTDTSPFECKLKNKNQNVDFVFNDSATDASSGCDYALAYVNDVSGQGFSGTQTLSCASATLDFSVTGTPNSSNPKCEGLDPITEDPQIKLKTNKCGTDED